MTGSITSASAVHRRPPSSADAPVTAVASLARAATTQLAGGDLLRLLMEVCSEHLAVDGAGVMSVGGARLRAAGDGAGVMAVDGAGLRLAHADSPDVSRLELIQELTQQGPCYEALIDLREVVVSDIAARTEPPWAPYLSGAKAVGMESVLATPLLGRGRAWGVLELYRRSTEDWSAAELAAARMLSEVTASYLVMASDRDSARVAQRELAHSSMHDDLTGLPNRSLLFDRLGHALRQAARSAARVGVFFIDLDSFKQINDTFGHAAGDAVLVESTRRMSATLRKEDTLARLSGDEFVLVCEDLPQQDDDEVDRQIGVVTDRISRALSEPVHVAGTDLVISASVGVALSDDATSADDLLADADAAMYRVKQLRRSAEPERIERSARTVPDVDLRLRRFNRQLERDLAQALQLGQMQVHYQPVFLAGNAAVPAVEALLRWQHPTAGLLVAAEFVDLAVGSGMIVPIGHWVIEQACAQMRSWGDLLGVRAPATTYVNLSGRQLADPALAQVIAVAVDRHGLSPAQLGLELVEDSFIDAQLVELLHSYHRRGHPLALDDFGTGYSSLSQLIDLPVDLAKIDHSLVAHIAHDPRSLALVDAVLVVATSLGLEVIGKGVETAEQAHLLVAAGCRLHQGFYYGAVETPEALTAAWTRSESATTDEHR